MKKPMTLGEQVRDAQRVVNGWSSQKRDSVQLEGSGIQYYRAKAHSNTIPVDKFGKDHWSLLAYVESVCVGGRDGIGLLDRRRMRCHPKHQLLAASFSSMFAWKTKWSTRLAGYFEFAERNDTEMAISAGFQMRDHDDWDCLDDLEAAGFVDIISLSQCTVKMAKEGIQVAHELCRHKASGGHFANFRIAFTV